MKESRKKKEQRVTGRRKKLSETEFRRLIEKDKVRDMDQRVYKERRKTKRRKRQVGL